MIKLSKVIGISLIGLAFATTSVYADVNKGADIFKQNMRKSCGFSGNIMAKKHTQKEWQYFYESGKLSDELRDLCPKAKPLSDDLLEYLYNFLYNFASDSGNNAVCY